MELVVAVGIVSSASNRREGIVDVDGTNLLGRRPPTNQALT